MGGGACRRTPCTREPSISQRSPKSARSNRVDGLYLALRPIVAQWSPSSLYGLLGQDQGGIVDFSPLGQLGRLWPSDTFGPLKPHLTTDR
jgi:hypothetical protein